MLKNLQRIVACLGVMAGAGLAAAAPAAAAPNTVEPHAGDFCVYSDYNFGGQSQCAGGTSSFQVTFIVKSYNNTFTAFAWCLADSAGDVWPAAAGTSNGETDYGSNYIVKAFRGYNAFDCGTP